MGALHTLGLIYADKRNFQRAFDCLSRAVMLNPRSWNTLTALSGVYLELGAKEMAAQALEQAKLIKPQDTNVLVTLGEIYREEREYELARDTYRQAAQLEKDLAPAAMGLGECSAALGEYPEAAAVFEELVKRGKRLLDPLFALAGLPASVVRIDLISELDRVVREASEDKAEFESSLAFARAAALDKAGRHAEAWEQVVPANRAMFVAMKRDLPDMAERRRASLAALQANSAKAVFGAGGGRGPISLFILGASRSGKTTMESLVATLDGVKRGYENPSVKNAIRRTFQTAALLTSNFLENLPPRLDSLCREFYLEELARRAGTARVFTNTHPVRIRDAARMLAAFLNVRLILMKRDLNDNVLRIFLR
jgi:tetratricopeptide (TPR) repeat protein